MFDFLRRLWTRREYSQSESAAASVADASRLGEQLECARQALIDGNAHSAIAVLEHLTDSHADSVEAWRLLGDALHRVGRYDDALDALQIGLAHDRAHAPMHHLLGLVHLRRGDPIKAHDSLKAAAHLAPRSSDILSDLGYVLLTQLDQAQASLEVLDRALQIEPKLQAAICNRAAALAALGRTGQALEHYDALLAQGPKDTEVRFNRSIALLTLGRYAEAWPDYELRRTTSALFTRRTCPLPEWDGRKLNGKRLLVLAEQGLGDEIMFASCFDELATYADAQLVLDCSPKLGALFARSFPGHIVRAAAQSLPLPPIPTAR